MAGPQYQEMKKTITLLRSFIVQLEGAIKAATKKMERIQVKANTLSIKAKRMKATRGTVVLVRGKKAKAKKKA